MDKKTFTVLFTIVSSIANIIFTLLVIFILLVLSTLVLVKGLKIEGEIVMVAWMICFIAGMIISMFGFTKLTSLVIQKFHLEDKLSKNRNPNAQKKERPKTVMPDSVLPKAEDKDLWAEQIENSTYGASFGLDELQKGIEENNAQAQALIAEREAEAQEWEKNQNKKSAKKESTSPSTPEASALPPEPLSFGREELEKLQNNKPTNQNPSEP